MNFSQPANETMLCAGCGEAFPEDQLIEIESCVLVCSSDCADYFRTVIAVDTPAA